MVKWNGKRDVIGMMICWFLFPILFAILVPIVTITVFPVILVIFIAVVLAVGYFIFRKESHKVLDKKYSGKFIVLDGPDGCGKSSQTRMLSDWLVDNGAEVVSFRDPGTTAIGEKVRKILLDTANEAMCVRTELLLYMAARAQLWQEEIKPALENGKTVVLDRWVSSTCAYQGCAGGFGIKNVIKIADGCLERVWPDMTIVLDLDIETSAKRLDAQLDRMELKGSEYHQKVREGFLELCKYSDNVAIVNSADDIETVHKNVVQVINDRLAG